MPRLKIAFIVLLAFGACHAMAGVRGLRVVMLSLENTDFFESDAYVSFRNGEASRLPAAQECWNKRATAGESLSHTTRKKLPPGITKKLGIAIWNRDKEAMRTAQKLLRLGDQHSGPNGYDGMFIIRLQKTQIEILGIGANTPNDQINSIQKIKLLWDRENSAQTASHFDLALCQAAKAMDYKFNP